MMPIPPLTVTPVPDEEDDAPATPAVPLGAELRENVLNSEPPREGLGEGELQRRWLRFLQHQTANDTGNFESRHPSYNLGFEIWMMQEYGSAAMLHANHPAYLAYVQYIQETSLRRANHSRQLPHATLYHALTGI